MKLLRKWKYIYWFLVFIFLTYLVIRRLPVFLSGNPSNMDIIVFVIWIAFIISPIFREVNIFGVGLKNEFDSLRNDVRAEMLNIRSEIRNTINFSPQINVGQPPSDSELPRVKEAVRKPLEEMFGNKDIIREQISISPDVQYLFSVRYNLEMELNRVWRLHAASKSDERPRSPAEIMRLLTMKGTIDTEFYNAIRDVYAVSNAAIHGLDVSQAKINFVREMAPQLLAYLQSLPVSQPKDDI